jgi:predicted ferric reductase
MTNSGLAPAIGRRSPRMPERTRPVRPVPPAGQVVSRLNARQASAVSSDQSDLKDTVTWTLRLVFYGIAAIIMTLWLKDGGISGVHSTSTLLISVGRFTGLFGAYLLLLQILLLARLPFLEWTVGFDKLMKRHRLNGKLSIMLILAHVATITAGYAQVSQVSILSEAGTLLSSYPGMIAALAGTLMLILVVFTSIVIVRRKLRYETWFLVHLMAYAGIFLAWFHQVPTGSDFLASPLAAAFWTALYVATLQLVVLFRILQPVLGFLWHRMRVTEVTQEAPGVVSLRISGHHLDWLHARPGQWFQWRFLDQERWAESHPFSLSAAPDGKSFRITIKDLGDFSSRIAHIRPGTFVMAEGPFGSFTEESRSRDRVALIAGGVGITPIRALLEEMSGDVVLIYRARQAKEIVFRSELEALAHDRGFSIRYVIGDRRTLGNAHLLSREHLRSLVPDIASREVYLCGPAGMMRSLKSVVRRLGVPKSLIHADEFAF